MIIHGSKLEYDYSILKNPTHSQLESAMYVRDSFDEDGYNEVETFADIKDFFDNWNQYEDYCEMYYNGIDSDECRKAYDEEHWDTVYDYITDCLHWYGGSFCPVHITE